VRAVAHPDAAAFLHRARPWLEEREDENNLVLSIAAALAEAPTVEGDDDPPLFGTVEDGGDVVGCFMRTPPHKLVLTRMPTAGVGPVVEIAASRWASVPAVLGPAEVARPAGEAWVARHGGSARPGMRQRIYRLDAVRAPADVPGRMRAALPEDLPLVDVWNSGFAEDAGHQFHAPSAARDAWVREGRLVLWEDGAPVAMAVAGGRTRNGVRVGYVYTPPERRRRGYASALVARLSQSLLDDGFRFCVLYTDLANPTSNGIYARIGYRPICDVEDVNLEPGA
jgi:predicted GNAT family acetyltransferase